MARSSTSPRTQEIRTAAAFLRDHDAVRGDRTLAFLHTRLG